MDNRDCDFMLASEKENRLTNLLTLSPFSRTRDVSCVTPLSSHHSLSFITHKQHHHRRCRRRRRRCNNNNNNNNNEQQVKSAVCLNMHT